MRSAGCAVRSSDARTHRLALRSLHLQQRRDAQRLQRLAQWGHHAQRLATRTDTRSLGAVHTRLTR